MSDPISIHRPAGPATALMLLFHGAGSTPQNMVPIGQRLAAEFPGAAIFSVPSPDVSDMGSGYQWFSVRGITEDNRAERIAATMPRFAATVRSLQTLTGTTAEQTVLIGFSQGAIMSLESTLLEEALAGRIVSFAGRFAQLPSHAAHDAALHFIHGRNDPVIAVGHALAAAERLTQLGAEVTVDLIPGLGHGINRAAEDAMVARLRAEPPQT